MDIKKRFSHHPPTEEAVDLHQVVRDQAGYVAISMDHFLPDCREKSLAITKLEEFMFWANAAIAREISAGGEVPK